MLAMVTMRGVQLVDTNLSSLFLFFSPWQELWWALGGVALCVD
jgi:hypothetical protein